MDFDFLPIKLYMFFVLLLGEMFWGIKALLFSKQIISLRLYFDQGFVVRKNKIEIEMQKVDDRMVPNNWIVQLFRFYLLFPHLIRNPNTTLYEVCSPIRIM